jgi:aryl sulfotransferase
LPEVFKRISQEYNETLFFKTHDAWTLTQESKSIFPEEVTKGVIYIIRNPLDIAVSYSYHNGNKIDKTINDMNRKAYSVCSDEKELKIQLPQIMGSWSEHVDSWIRESNLPVHIMRYEDMLDNTNKSFTDALKFLDMKFSRKEVKNAIEKSSFQHLKELEGKEGFKERSIHSDSFFRKGLQDDWKNVLTPSQVEKIVNQHSEMMRKFGYLN